MADCRALVTLTSEESKWLIAKGIAALPVVQKAREKGIICFWCRLIIFFARPIAPFGIEDKTKLLRIGTPSPT